jgi:hypothetical protein
MSTFTEKPSNLFQSGPLIAVRLWVPQQMTTIIPSPPMHTLAKIDTASVHTYIQEGVATSLGLKPKDTVTITTMTTRSFESYIYHIRVVFPHGKAVDVLAVEVPYMLHPHARIKCAIGRDILQLGVLIYNGRGNTFLFDF